MAGLDLYPVFEIMLVVFLLVTSAAYTAAEVALTSLLRADRANRADRDEDEAVYPEGDEPIPEEIAHPIRHLLAQPDVLSATIIIGRLTMRVLAVVVLVLLAFQWPLLLTAIGSGWLLTAAVLGSLLLVLVITEVLPRIFGSRWPESTLLWTTPLVRLSGFVLLPFTLSLTRLLKHFGPQADEDATFQTAEELRHLLEEREGDGRLEAEDREMIEDLLVFGETMAREVMVPRIDIAAVDLGDDFTKVRQIVRETGHSRLPLYDGDIDHIVGLIHSKDLLRLQESEEVPLRELARPAPFVPETKKIDDLLREFQHTKTHMAIVVDEYGGTSGLVTLEDLIEEIVGEIQDEYDFETPMIRHVAPDRWEVEAMIGIDEFEEAVGILLPRDGYDTLGGFIYSLEGRFPDEGDTLSWETLDFLIRETRERRIIKVEVVVRPLEATDESA
ncbi:hemolysin family protein [Gemmatimonadota bacterium]